MLRLPLWLISMTPIAWSVGTQPEAKESSRRIRLSVLSSAGRFRKKTTSIPTHLKILELHSQAPSLVELISKLFQRKTSQPEAPSWL